MTTDTTETTNEPFTRYDMALLRNDGTEPTDPAYARQSVTFIYTANHTKLTNSHEVRFPTAVEDWGELTACACYTVQGALAGAVIPLILPRAVPAKHTMLFPPGSVAFLSWARAPHP